MSVVAVRYAWPRLALKPHCAKRANDPLSAGTTTPIWRSPRGTRSLLIELLALTMTLSWADSQRCRRSRSRAFVGTFDHAVTTLSKAGHSDRVVGVSPFGDREAHPLASRPDVIS